MSSLYTEMQWLPQAPSDFADRVRKLATSEAVTGQELQSLASFALNLNQLTRLAKLIAKAQAQDRSLEPLKSYRLGVLSNSTMDLTVPAFVASAARHGIALEVIPPSYDQVAQEALAADSKINTGHVDAVLFAIDFRSLPIKISPGDTKSAEASVRGAIAYLQTLRSGIKAHSNAVCIFQTFAPPVEGLFGSLDRSLAGTLRNLLERINLELAAFVYGSGDVLLDTAAIAECVGAANWHAPDLWNLGKIPFSSDFIPLYADHVARTIATLLGKSRKVLILDLDNTMWGGVIGDDGLEGIKVAQGDALGEAHLSIQRLALELRDRGVILAVSSKNTDEIAREPFEKHPEMLLRLRHIAVFQSNWNDKASNIISIAKELSLGLDSMVLLDDNPVERGLVRTLLPQVAVPELPEDPAYYTRTLSAAGYFEAVSFSGEDLKRASFYEDNAKRSHLQSQLGGVENYLAALDMTITFDPFNVQGRARIVQLINKSNQYNLTTRRYTEPEIDAVMSDPGIFTLQVRLADIFGDNGMISVVICRTAHHGTAWELDTWLMSCRVLGRNVENAVLAEILKHARAEGIERLIGIYRPTEKNKLVLNHYSRLGFSKLHEEESKASYWELAVSDTLPKLPPMKIISHLHAGSEQRLSA